MQIISGAIPPCSAVQWQRAADRRHCGGDQLRVCNRKMLLKGANVGDDLPDLIVTEVLVRGHIGSGRAILDCPEYLAIGNVGRTDAGQVARGRREVGGHRTLSVTGATVTRRAGVTAGHFVKVQLFALLGTDRDWIGAFVDFIRRTSGKFWLWAICSCGR